MHFPALQYVLKHLLGYEEQEYPFLILQAPLPSHAQEGCVHWPMLEIGRLVQTPEAPQVWQGEVHGVSQQKLLTQKPELQSPPPLQLRPSGHLGQATAPPSSLPPQSMLVSVPFIT